MSSFPWVLLLHMYNAYIYKKHEACSSIVHNGRVLLQRTPKNRGLPKLASLGFPLVSQLFTTPTRYQPSKKTDPWYQLSTKKKKKKQLGPGWVTSHVPLKPPPKRYPPKKWHTRFGYLPISLFSPPPPKKRVPTQKTKAFPLFSLPPKLAPTQTKRKEETHGTFPFPPKKTNTQKRRYQLKKRR